MSVRQNLERVITNGNTTNISLTSSNLNYFRLSLNYRTIESLWDVSSIVMNTSSVFCARFFETIVSHYLRIVLFCFPVNTMIDLLSHTSVIS